MLLQLEWEELRYILLIISLYDMVKYTLICTLPTGGTGQVWVGVVQVPSAWQVEVAVLLSDEQVKDLTVFMKALTADVPDEVKQVPAELASSL